MKNYWIFLLLAFIASSCQDFVDERLAKSGNAAIETRAAEAGFVDYYWYNGEKIYLTRSEKYVNVVTDGKLVKSSKAEVEANSISRGKEAKYILPFFERGEGLEPIGTSDIFYLKLKNTEDIALLKEMAGELGVQIIEDIPHTPRWYILSILGSNFGSSIEAGNYFYETGKFEGVDPAFMFEFKQNTDDTDFWRQWGMNNTSNPNIDINVIPAWDITRGAGIKVAVVDTPIESGHSDLDGNMHSLSYNARLKRSPSAAYTGGSAHGTHVAGIIAAEKNGTQVTGVAYESKIVRVSHDMSLTNVSAEMASGINWAWKSTTAGGAGVDVINCSWGDEGGRQYHLLHSTVLEQAIVDAMTQGRRGNGCVVVFTAGNNGNQTMNYPGYFHPDILDVGAIDSNGSRRYNSSYGSALDVVAPGGDIWSTIPYSSIGENHGTSMAAPHVAGVAALILSDNPNLTRQQVVNKIESTAKKVGGYSYTSTFRRPNGTWNNEMGYGLIDAYAALNSAPAISHELIRQPNSNLMTVVFSVDNPEPGVTYQWGLNKAIFSNGGNPYVALLSAFLYDGNPRLTQLEATLKCRAVRNGIYSAWSNSIRHVVQSTTPIPYTP